MKILCIEGMGDFPAIQNQLVPYLSKDHEFTFVAWNDQKLQSTNWLSQFQGIIGHSLGGYVALLASRLAKWCVTLDPRIDNNTSWWDWLLPLLSEVTYPAVIPNTYNFIHEPPVLFPGHFVTGAKSNTYLLCSHLDIPGQQAIIDQVTKLLSQ